MGQSRGESSLGDLFAELSAEITALVRQELALAKVELTEKITRMSRNAALLVIGGAIIYAGFLATIGALIIGIGLLIGSIVVAAFVVAVVVLGVGYGFVRRGLTKLKSEDITPRETLDTLKTNVNWAKDQLK